MANMLGSKGNGACKCCNDPLVPKRVNRKREKRQWHRDYEAGEFSDDTRHFSWWHDLMEEVESNDPYWQEVAGQYLIGTEYWD